MTEEEEIALLRRVLELRRRRLIGSVWYERGCFWVARSELDPMGTRERVSVEEMRALADAAERKPAAREISVEMVKKKACS